MHTQMNRFFAIVASTILLLTACTPAQQVEVANTPAATTQATSTSSAIPTTPPTLAPTASQAPTVQPTETNTPQPSPTSPPATSITVDNSTAIVVDHTSIDLFDQIPDEYILAASKIRLMVRGASVEENINQGLDCLWGNFPGRRPSRCFATYDLKYDRSNWSFQFRANPGWIDKVKDFVTFTEQQIDNYDAFSFVFGYVDGIDESTYPSISDPTNFQQHYIEKIVALENAHPDKIFIVWTMSVARTGFRNEQEFNNMVRQYVLENNKIFLDIADIESHDPEGNKSTNELGIDVLFDGYTEEERSGHLNRTGQERMAKAVWVLMARIAGWDGKP